MILFLSVSLSLLTLLVIFMLIKSYYHFEYLKRINPDKFSKYVNIFMTKSLSEFHNIYMFRMSLIFPWFARKYPDEDEKAIRLAQKVKTFNKLIVVNVMIMLIYVIVLIVFFSEPV